MSETFEEWLTQAEKSWFDQKFNSLILEGMELFCARLAAKQAWHARDAEIAALETKLQRATDLVRYARGYLHKKGVITHAEFATIAQDSEGRVARLEGYDKAVIDMKAALVAKFAEEVKTWGGTDHIRMCRERILILCRENGWK